MNEENNQKELAEKLKNASLRVRDESMKVNSEFDLIADDQDSGEKKPIVLDS